MSDGGKFKLPIQYLIEAGPDAARVLVRHIVETSGRDMGTAARQRRANDSFDVEAHLDRLIKSQLTLARSEGAGAGAVASLAELAAAPAGPTAVVASVAATVLADIAALAWIQIRLSLMIAAAYGHDMSDIETRVSEILSLHGLETTVGKSAAPAGQRVGKRLLERYLRGNLLQALKAMFRLVGIKFSRAALIRGLPLVNIPVNASIADITTRRTSSKARTYYRTLPPQ